MKEKRPTKTYHLAIPQSIKDKEKFLKVFRKKMYQESVIKMITVFSQAILDARR